MLSVTAYAEKFTPSVEQKGAPEIVAVNDKSGNEVCAVIVDAHGNDVLAGELVIQVSPDLCQVEFEGRHRFAVHYYSGY